jgi:hypothetical protein
VGLVRCYKLTSRLGWTGDLQAFAPTAAFLYETNGFLANWLHDLSAEQLKQYDGVVPLVVPNTLDTFTGTGPPAQAVWVRATSSEGAQLTRIREMSASSHRKISTWHTGRPRSSKRCGRA